MQAIWNIRSLRERFDHSVIINVPRTLNTRAENLTCSVRKQLSFVVHMDAELPI